MTTKVTIEACCAADKLVRVSIVDSTMEGREVSEGESAEISSYHPVLEEFTLQSGDIADRVIYGSREIRVREEAQEPQS